MSIIDNLSRKKIADMRRSMFSPYNFKGSTTYAKLPTVGNNVNDTYYCTDKNCKYTWNGSGWYQSGLNESEYEAQILKLQNTMQSNYEALEKADEENYNALLEEIEKNKNTNTGGSGATAEQIEQITKNAADIDDLSDDVLSLNAEVKSATLTCNPDNGYIVGEYGVYFNHVTRAIVSEADLIGAKVTILKTVDETNVEETIVLDPSNIVNENGVIYVGTGFTTELPNMLLYVVSEDLTELGDGVFEKGVWFANSDEYSANGEVYFVKNLSYGANLKKQVEQNAADIKELKENGSILTEEEIEAFKKSINNKVNLPLDDEGNANVGEAGQFAISDGNGGITWQSLAIAEEGAY